MIGSTMAKPATGLGATFDGIAYYLAFTFRDGEMRPISLRRAHAKEMKRYVKKA